MGGLPLINFLIPPVHLTDKKMERLTKKQKQAVTLLSKGLQTHAIADKLEVSRQTLWAWKKKQVFQKELLQLRQSQLEHVGLSLLSMGAEAVQTLRRCMKSGDASIALRAAKTVLDQLDKIAEAQQQLETIHQNMLDQNEGTN